jgi:UDP-N-acetylmuramoyl-tripeptide--D-alanyl-D-alanine ligase
MMELGKYSADEHKKAGREAAGIVGRLFTVGQRSRATAEEAIKSGLAQEAVLSFDSATEAAEHVKALIRPSDVILTKGSQSIRMERVTKALLADPERSGELLVRQEKEWLEKA